MKIQLPSYQALREVPKEMKALWDNFGLLCETLKTAFEGGISLEDNVSHALVSVQLQHGLVTRIPNPLGRKPKVCIPISNRAEFIEVLKIDATSVVVRARLLTTIATPQFSAAFTTNLKVPDSEFFNGGDTVYVNGISNKISGIIGNEVFLENNISGVTSVTLSLASDKATFLLM